MNKKENNIGINIPTNIIILDKFNYDIMLNEIKNKEKEIEDLKNIINNTIELVKKEQTTLCGEKLCYVDGNKILEMLEDEENE